MSQLDSDLPYEHQVCCPRLCNYAMGQFHMTASCKLHHNLTYACAVDCSKAASQAVIHKSAPRPALHGCRLSSACEVIVSKRGLAEVPESSPDLTKRSSA